MAKGKKASTQPKLAAQLLPQPTKPSSTIGEVSSQVQQEW